jgi:hypothetical protein
LGSSGLGKDGAKSFLEQIFSDNYGHLKGQGKRGSANILIDDLAAKRNLLDIQDEYHAEVKKMFSKNAIHAHGAIPLTINELYSANWEYSPSTSLSGKKEGQATKLYSPFYSLFAAGTIESLLRAVPVGDMDCFNNGFFNRFLFFLSKPSLRESTVDDFLKKGESFDVKFYHKEMEKFFSHYPLVDRNGNKIPHDFNNRAFAGSCYHPLELKFDSAGELAWAEAMVRYKEKRDRAYITGDLITGGLLSRMIENACRVATALAAFKYKDYVGAEEFNWAMSLVEYCFSTVHPLFTGLADRVAYNDFATFEDRILVKFLNVGVKGITLSKLHDDFKRTMSKKQVLDALNSMVHTGTLTRINHNGGFKFFLSKIEMNRLDKKKKKRKK